jgi:acyl carrier protein
LDTAPVSERHALLTTHVAEQVAQIIGVPPTHLLQDQEQGFITLGLDSLGTIDLRNRLQRSLECRLPPTFAFTYATITAAATYLHQHLFPATTPPQDDSPPARPEPAPPVSAPDSDDASLATLLERLAQRVAADTNETL